MDKSEARYDRSQWYIGSPNGIVACIDGMDGWRMDGRLYCRFSDRAAVFRNAEQLVERMEQLFDGLNFPRATTEGRSFDGGPSRTAGRKEAVSRNKVIILSGIADPNGAGQNGIADLNMATRQSGVVDLNEAIGQSGIADLNEAVGQNRIAERRGAIARKARTAVMKDEELLKQHGELGTFVVRVQHRQNNSWQGRITWMEENKTLHFRSVWEMVKLIENALNTKIDPAELEQEPSWFPEE